MEIDEDEKRRNQVAKSLGNNIFNTNGRGVASNPKLDAVSIKYVTCLKLKYPPNIFSSLLISKGTLKTLINIRLLTAK